MLTTVSTVFPGLGDSISANTKLSAGTLPTIDIKVTMPIGDESPRSHFSTP